jgi:hypothetical protein
VIFRWVWLVVAFVFGWRMLGCCSGGGELPQHLDKNGEVLLEEACANSRVPLGMRGLPYSVRCNYVPYT